MEQKSSADGLAVASLILGIISLIFCWLWWLGLITGILGLIFAVKGRRSVTKKGLATAGLVLSILGVVFSGLFTLCVVCVGATGCAFANASNW